MRDTAPQLQLLVDTSWLLAAAVLYKAEAWQGILHQKRIEA